MKRKTVWIAIGVMIGAVVVAGQRLRFISNGRRRSLSDNTNFPLQMKRAATFP
jgi:hypothetical protein